MARDGRGLAMPDRDGRDRDVPDRGDVRGRPVDAQTRCVHWASPLDVVAFRFACCGGWWPCRSCHDGTAGHAALVWPRGRASEPSVLCGVCGHAMTAAAYQACGSACPRCGAGFNPACRAHWPDYFA